MLKPGMKGNEVKFKFSESPRWCFSLLGSFTSWIKAECASDPKENLSRTFYKQTPFSIWIMLSEVLFEIRVTCVLGKQARKVKFRLLHLVLLFEIEQKHLLIMPKSQLLLEWKYLSLINLFIVQLLPKKNFFKDYSATNFYFHSLQVMSQFLLSLIGLKL